jgi:transposase
MVIEKTQVWPADKAGDSPKGKVGRPTTYKPEYCDRVVELGAKGYSQAMIIADIGAGSRETIDNWKKRHPEFLDAMTRARDLALAWWERIGLENTGNRDFNANLYRVIMMARFGQDGYREKQVIEPVQGGSGVDVRQLTPAEREMLAALLTKAKIQQPNTTPPVSSPARKRETSTATEPVKTDRGAVH